MSIGDETAERLAPHQTTWAADGTPSGVLRGDPRPRSHNSGSGGPPVPPLPDRLARRVPAGQNPGTATPDVVPAWVTAGALPPPAPAVTSLTPAEGAVPTTATRSPAGHQAPAAPACPSADVSTRYLPMSGQGRLVQPPPGGTLRDGCPDPAATADLAGGHGPDSGSLFPRTDGKGGRPRSRSRGTAPTQTPAAPAHGVPDSSSPSAGRLVQTDGRCSGIEGAFRPTSGHPAGGEGDWPTPGLHLPSPPVPHDPDRPITDSWYEEPDPAIPAAHIALWFVLAALAWALLLVGAWYGLSTLQDALTGLETP